MQTHSKRYDAAAKQAPDKTPRPLAEAITILAGFPRAKFRETVEIAFNLGIDPKQSDQNVRGTVALPHGVGKKVRVLVFTKPGASADAARAAGADHVGFDDLIQKVTGGWTDFDIAIATPEAMKEGVAKLGKVLGPRGLMPNPKTGTVTEDVGKAIKEVQAGRVEFKIDKAANLHVPVGKVDFAAAQLVDNAQAVIDAVVKARPASAKGVYIKSCTVSSTMSPGVRVHVKQQQ